MIPRTVLMAQAVENLLSSTELAEYGNIIYNGSSTAEPNTAGVLAWQYKETTATPVPLPTVPLNIPALKGWTTNYMSYFTRGEQPYSLYPGQENPFLFDIWNYYQTPGPVGPTGPATQIGGVGDGTNPYYPGTYVLPATGGSGSGLVCELVVSPVPLPGLGQVTSITVVNGGTGYAIGDFPIDFNIPFDATINPAPTGKFSVDAIGSTTTVSAAGYSQCPHRTYQNQVLPGSSNPSVNNPAAIAYSFIHPIQDRTTPPPIDYVAP